MLLRKLDTNYLFRRNGNALNTPKINRCACAAVPIASNGSLRRTASCGILLQHLLTEHGGDWRAACSSAPVSVNSIPPVSLAVRRMPSVFVFFLCSAPSYLLARGPTTTTFVLFCVHMDTYVGPPLLLVFLLQVSSFCFPGPFYYLNTPHFYGCVSLRLPLPSLSAPWFILTCLGLMSLCLVS